MSLLKNLINIGTETQNDVVRKKHIRFTNSLALIICLFAVQNIILSIYFKQTQVAFIQLVHFVLLALIPFFNYKNRPILASGWFSVVAIFFVTLYSILLTLESLNFTFLPMIIFLQFFLFSHTEVKYVIVFVAATALCFVGVFLTVSWLEPPLLYLPQGFVNAQKWNTVVGLPMLSATVGAYAFFTIKKANEELAKEKDDLKSAQTQLIQSEKMASLGELTAGIAHEIQNPLNFVNNFSEVSIEFVDETIEEVEALKTRHALSQQHAFSQQQDSSQDKESLTDIGNLLGDIKSNLEKINHHGQRAAGIVRGMLEHSRKSDGKKELTDVNALCDEYLRLSYHGYRAKDQSFNATIETHFDPALPKVSIVPQDIGRVILNIFNNAFYAINERNKNEKWADSLPKALGVGGKHSEGSISEYIPTVIVSTKYLGDKIEISIKDNGNGIPDHIKDKIFQPFFTTKPTGQGTGLGLSLAYDIVTKGHGGRLKVEAKEGEGSEFVIQIPQPS